MASGNLPLPFPLRPAPAEQLWEKCDGKEFRNSRAMLSHAFLLSYSSAPNITMQFPLQGILYHWRLKAHFAAVWFGPCSDKQVNCRNAEVNNQDRLGWRQRDKKQQVRVWFASFSYTSSCPATDGAWGRASAALQEAYLLSRKSSLWKSFRAKSAFNSTFFSSSFVAGKRKGGSFPT